MTNKIHNETNAKRVEKMMDTLKLIGKSAKSNKATADDLAELLTPLIRKLRPLMGAASPAGQQEPAHTSGRVGSTAPQWASVQDMAREASLKDLTGAMAVYLNRIDEALDDEGV